MQIKSKEAGVTTRRCNSSLASTSPRCRPANIPDVREVSYWFASGPGASTGDMPPDVAAILERYRVPVIG